MGYSEQEQELLIKIARIYKKVKFLTTKAEVINKKKFAKMSIYDQFRNSYDHLMRFVNGCDEHPENVNENKENLDLSYKHIFRAAFDVFDLMEIIYSEKIDRMLRKYNEDLIRTEIPEYYDKYWDEMEETEKEVGKIRANKDSAKKTEEIFDKYFSLVERLDEIYLVIKGKEKKLRHLKRKSWASAIKDPRVLISIIITAIVSLFIGIFLP